jgi:hypothetical protein
MPFGKLLLVICLHEKTPPFSVLEVIESVCEVPGRDIPVQIEPPGEVILPS